MKNISSIFSIKGNNRDLTKNISKAYKNQISLCPKDEIKNLLKCLRGKQDICYFSSPVKKNFPFHKVIKD